MDVKLWMSSGWAMALPQSMAIYYIECRRRAPRSHVSLPPSLNEQRTLDLNERRRLISHTTHATFSSASDSPGVAAPGGTSRLATLLVTWQ